MLVVTANICSIVLKQSTSADNVTAPTHMQQQTSATTEAMKAKIVKDGRTCWDFFPKVRNYASPVSCSIYPRPNFGMLLVLMTAFVEQLHENGENELAEQVLRNSLDFRLEESRKYSQTGALGWEPYQKRYGYSPCCSCDWQSSVSGTAITLGFNNLAEYAVTLRCPVAPSHYSREVAEAYEIGPERRAANASILESFLKGEFDFFQKKR